MTHRKTPTSQGSTLVEFAVVSLLLLTVLFAGFYLSLAAYHWIGLRYSIAREMRRQSVQTSFSVPALKDKIISRARGLGLIIKPEEVYICALDDFSGGCTYPNPEDSFVVTVISAQKTSVLNYKYTWNLKISLSSIGNI